MSSTDPFERSVKPKAQGAVPSLDHMLPIVLGDVRLRKFVSTDLPAMHVWLSDPRTVRYLYGGVRSRNEAQQELTRKMLSPWPLLTGDSLFLAIELDGVAIGEIVLKMVDVDHRQGEIGYTLNPAHEGRGLVTRAARQVLLLGFDVLALHRICARTDADNAASIRVMEKLGMRKEAHLRHNEIFKGRWGDEVVFAIVEDEWRFRSRA